MYCKLPCINMYLVLTILNCVCALYFQRFLKKINFFRHYRWAMALIPTYPGLRSRSQIEFPDPTPAYQQTIP